MAVSLFHGSIWSDPCVKDTVFISWHILKLSIITRRFGWFEIIWRVCLFEESHCRLAILKMSIYSTELVAVIFVWKVLCLKMHMKASDSFMVNVLIWQYHNINWNLSIVNFFEEQLWTFALSKVTFGTSTFSRELLFGVLIALIFFWNIVAFRNSYFKTIYLKPHTFVNTIYFFQNCTCTRRTFFKVVKVVH